MTQEVIAPREQGFVAKKDEFLSREMTRREFNSGILNIAKNAVLLAALGQARVNIEAYKDGVYLPFPERSEPVKPRPAYSSYTLEENQLSTIANSIEGQEAPRRRKIITVAHRGGNNERDMEAAAAAGFDYVDMDLSSIRGLIKRSVRVGHGNKLSVLGVQFGEYDRAEGKLKLFTQSPTFDHMCRVARKLKIGISAQYKRGDFDEEDINGIYESALKAGVSIMTHSESLDDVAIANRAIQRLADEFMQKGLEAKAQAVAMHPEAWADFLDAGHDGILTNLESAEYYRDQLVDIFVTVGEMNTIEQIEKAKKNRAINAIMADAGILVRNISLGL